MSRYRDNESLNIYNDNAFEIFDLSFQQRTSVCIKDLDKLSLAQRLGFHNQEFFLMIHLASNDAPYIKSWKIIFLLL